MFFSAAVKSGIVLLPLLGFTWLFGILAFDQSTVVFMYIFVILNAFQVSEIVTSADVTRLENSLTSLAGSNSELYSL